MIDIGINIAGIILLAVVAFSCGYEKGRGDAMEEEIDFLERIKKDREEEKENANESKS